METTKNLGREIDALQYAFIVTNLSESLIPILEPIDDFMMRCGIVSTTIDDFCDRDGVKIKTRDKDLLKRDVIEALSRRIMLMSGSKANVVESRVGPSSNQKPVLVVTGDSRSDNYESRIDTTASVIKEPVLGSQISEENHAECGPATQN